MKLSCLFYIKILLLVLSSHANAQIIPTFSYGGESKNNYCGNIDIKFSIVSDKGNKTLQENELALIDLNEYDSIPSIKIEFNSLDLGYDSSCQTSKNIKENHANNYYLLLGSSSDNSVLKQVDNNISLKLGSQKNTKKWPTNQTIPYSIIQSKAKAPIKDKISITYKLMDKNGQETSEQQVITQAYQIIPKRIEADVPINKAIVEDTITSIIAEDEHILKITIEDSSSILPLVDRPIEAEAKAWAAIETAHSNKNNKKLAGLCWRYKEDCRKGIFADCQYIQDVFYYHAQSVEDSKKEAVINRYLYKFPAGKYVQILKKQLADNDDYVVDRKEQRAWRKVMKKNTKEAYQSYLKTNKNAKYQSIADLKVEDFFVDLKEEQSKSALKMYRFVFRGHENKTPIVRVLKNRKKIAQPLILDSLSLIVHIYEGSSVVLELSVEDSPWKTKNIRLDAISKPLSAQTTIKKKDEMVQFTEIKGGKPPYFIELIDIDRKKIVKQFDIGDSVNWTLSLKQLNGDDIQLGNYVARLVDQGKFYSITTSSFRVEPHQAMSWWKWALIFGISILFLVSTVVVWNNNKRKKREISKNIQEEKVSKIEPNAPILKEQQAGFLLSNNRNDIRNKIKVLKRAKKYNQNQVEHKLLIDNLSNYYKIDMSKSWKSSIVSHIFMQKTCVNKIDQFIFHNEDTKHLAPKDTYEQGGFLLGRYELNEDKKTYRISLEEFVDIESEQQGVYQISFGAKAWSWLEKKLELHAEDNYHLIGWLHTHPGHGLFLSRPDLVIHENFFKQPFQIAVEIDNIRNQRNPSFDLGIFTRQLDGNINNVKELKHKWYQWNTLTQWLAKFSNNRYLN